MDFTNINLLLNNESYDKDLIPQELKALLELKESLESEISTAKSDLDAEREENQLLQRLTRLNEDTLLPLKREYMKDLGELIESRHAAAEKNPEEPLKPFAIAHIKLDDNFDQIESEQTKKIMAFKTVSLLSEIEMLKENMYQGDRLDDYLLILPNMRNSEAVEYLAGDMIIPAIRTIQGHGDVETIHLNCYVGIAVFPFHGENFIELNSNLELAIHEALRSRSRVTVFTERIGKDHHHRMEVRKALRLARVNGYEGFELRYQPFVDSTGKICGCESLIRWQHPSLGFLSPDLFISLAEQHGEMGMLGSWIFYRAIQDFRKWLDEGLDIESLSVNLSPVQFNQDRLTDSLKGMMDSLDIPYSSLKLEITEGTIMKDPEKSIKQLNELREIGFKIAIDDFGTGYSSLSYLMRLPLNTLKIDKSFVDEVENHENNMVIIKSIIDLANNLELDVIAEGVESSSQKELLFNEGVQYIQGYYYSKPVTNQEFEALLKSNDFSSR